MNVLLERKNSLLAELRTLVDTATTEKRDLTDDEKKAYSTKITEVRSISEQIGRDAELRALEITQPAKPTENKSEDPDDNKKALAEYRCFEAFLLGKKETRNATPVNMTYGANGAVIPDTIMDKVIDRVVEICPIFQYATKYAVPGDITIPKIDRSSGDITVAFAAEFSTLTANGFKFSSVTLSGKLAAGLVLISKQLINNSKIDIVSVVINKLAEKIAIFIENFLINGDSNISNSGLKGSIDSNNKLTVSSVASITGDTLIDVQDVIPDAYQPNSFWIMHSSLRTKIRKLKDGQGNYLLVPDYQKGSGYLLLGKPVYVTDNLPTATGASSGNTLLYYGDFSGLAVKTGESAEIQMLYETYATQHAIGINTWFEIDARIENTQKIAALALS